MAHRFGAVIMLPYTYALMIPSPQGEEKTHTQAKLRRWALAVLLGSPPMAIAETMAVTQDLQIRHPPELTLSYTWKYVDEGQVVGEPLEGKQFSIDLRQTSDGIHWKVAPDQLLAVRSTEDYASLLRQEARTGLVFYAHPRLHSFPWSISEAVSNKNVIPALKRQPLDDSKGVGS